MTFQKNTNDVKINLGTAKVHTYIHTLVPICILQCVLGIWTKLSWLCWFGIWLKQIYNNGQAEPKIIACIKSSQKLEKNNHIFISRRRNNFPVATGAQTYYLSKKCLKRYYFLSKKSKNVLFWLAKRRLGVMHLVQI
jgi:hypothetical protein